MELIGIAIVWWVLSKLIGLPTIGDVIEWIKGKFGK